MAKELWEYRIHFDDGSKGNWFPVESGLTALGQGYCCIEFKINASSETLQKEVEMPAKEYTIRFPEDLTWNAGNESLEYTVYTSTDGSIVLYDYSQGTLSVEPASVDLSKLSLASVIEASTPWGPSTYIKTNPPYSFRNLDSINGDKGYWQNVDGGWENESVLKTYEFVVKYNPEVQ